MFIFKKIVSRFFFPVPFILILLLAGLLLLWGTKKERSAKVLISAAVILLLLFSNTHVSKLLVSPLEAKHPPHLMQLRSEGSLIPPVKFIVVLGSGHVSDPSLPLTGQLDKEAVTRLTEAIVLHRKIPDAKLVLSGGRIYDPVANAVMMAKLAVELGVSKEDIIIEDRPRDTNEEARLIKAIVKDQLFMLITSASHMRRAMALFNNQGMTPIPAPTGQIVRAEEKTDLTSLFPGVNSLYISTRALYEYMGLAWAGLRGQI